MQLPHMAMCNSCQKSSHQSKSYPVLGYKLYATVSINVKSVAYRFLKIDTDLFIAYLSSLISRL